MRTPKEFVQSYGETARAKTTRGTLQLFLLALLAGFFIGIGGLVSMIASHAVANAGLAKLISGCLFPLGLIMVVWTGAELFTGNCLLLIGVMDRSITWAGAARNWVIVYLGNLLGGALLAIGCAAAGTIAAGTALGETAAAVGAAKAALPFGVALLRGVGCNILVCAAVQCAMCAKNAAGKALGAFVPVAAFVIAGFEHCVANAFYLPMAMLLGSVSFGGLVHNLIPVTLGNILGGFAFAAVMAGCNGK